MKAEGTEDLAPSNLGDEEEDIGEDINAAMIQVHG